MKHILLSRRLGALLVCVLASTLPLRVDAGNAVPAHKLTCDGEQVHPRRARTYRASVESGGWYRLAVRLLGQPGSCEMSWNDGEDGEPHPSITYEFARGTYSLESLPPESSTEKLMVLDGFPDPKAAISLLRKDSNFKDVNWSKPEAEKQPDGSVMKTFWDPDEGDNIGVDLVYLHKKLIGIGWHMAL